MPRGGYRPGAGRKKGSHITKTAAIVAKLAEDGATPLDVLLSTMRDENQPQQIRLQCATAAAPYVHPRLAHVHQSRATDPKIIENLWKLTQAAIENDKLKEAEKIKRESHKILTIDATPILSPSTVIDAVAMQDERLR